MNQLQMLVKIIPQLLSDGLALGFVYAIVALGYTMVYGILEFINFAHSELFMFGAFVGTEVLLFMQGIGWLPAMSPTLALLIAMAVAMILSGGLGVAVEDQGHVLRVPHHAHVRVLLQQMHQDRHASGGVVGKIHAAEARLLPRDQDVVIVAV